MKKSLAAMMIGTVAIGVSRMGENTSVGRPLKRASKCLLPGCEKYTTHNGGFCCAEHCKKAKKP